MKLRDFLADQVGGLIPLPGFDRIVHTVDGATYELSLSWLRRRFEASYHTPRLPRSVRRARAIESARLEAAGRERRLVASGAHRYQEGDIIPNWVTEIPDYVLEVRDSQFDVWSRPATEREAVYEGQRYDWVQRFEAGGVAGWTTNEGLHDHSPVTVTAVAVNTEDAHHTA